MISIQTNKKSFRIIFTGSGISDKKESLEALKNEVRELRAPEHGLKRKEWKKKYSIRTAESIYKRSKIDHPSMVHETNKMHGGG